MVGILRFVRRWLALGRVIRQVFPQICTVVFLLLLLFLIFAHTGIMVQICFHNFHYIHKCIYFKTTAYVSLCLFQLFSSSVEGFRTLGQASHSLLCLLRGRNGLHRLYEHHPVLGPLYCLCAVGIAFWVVGRLCAAILIRTYRIVQADIYRPSMEPQDYEMVQFLIKRLKLWMGLSKTKEVQIPYLTITDDFPNLWCESFINFKGHKQDFTGPLTFTCIQNSDSQPKIYCTDPNAA